MLQDAVPSVSVLRGPHCLRTRKLPGKHTGVMNQNRQMLGTNPKLPILKIERQKRYFR